ncbi:MAG: hypothetical protein ACJ72K_05920 [Friedmanniella sp.]
MFTTTVGTVIEPRNLLDALVVDAGVRRIRLHDMRRCVRCCCWTRDAGASGDAGPAALQLGITMNLYSHVMPSALREAADAIDRALGNPPSGQGGERPLC